jgi:hypothetical protein
MTSRRRTETLIMLTSMPAGAFGASGTTGRVCCIAVMMRVRCRNLVTPPGRTREPQRQADRTAGHEPRCARTHQITEREEETSGVVRQPILRIRSRTASHPSRKRAQDSCTLQPRFNQSNRTLDRPVRPRDGRDDNGKQRRATRQKSNCALMRASRPVSTEFGCSHGPFGTNPLL